MGDSATHTRAAAQAIASPEPAPDWLIAAAQSIVDQVLTGLVRYELDQPGRSDLKRRIKALRNAAQFILRELFPPMDGVPRISDPKVFPLRDFLLDAGEHWLESEADLLHGLRYLVERSEAKLTAMPTRGGQDRPLPAMVGELTVSGSTACALAVSILWERARGRSPALQDTTAHEACSELWRAAGGSVVRAKTAGWRVDLQESRKSRYQRERTILAAILGVQGIHP